jgi:hypothetical protein
MRSALSHLYCIWLNHIEELIQSSNSETGVKQTLNNLVNRAIVSSALISSKREADEDFVLPKNEWDRLRVWLKIESLDIQDFSDALAVLNTQPWERKKSDANSFLSEMLNSLSGSLYQWIKKQPEKQMAIMHNFMLADMGASAIEIAMSSSASEDLRITAIRYIKELFYLDAFDKLIGLASTAGGGLKEEALVTCAVLKPTHPRFTKEITKLLTRTRSQGAVMV